MTQNMSFSLICPYSLLQEKKKITSTYITPGRHFSYQLSGKGNSTSSSTPVVQHSSHNKAFPNKWLVTSLVQFYPIICKLCITGIENKLLPYSLQYHFLHFKTLRMFSTSSFTCLPTLLVPGRNSIRSFFLSSQVILYWSLISLIFFSGLIGVHFFPHLSWRQKPQYPSSHKFLLESMKSCLFPQKCNNFKGFNRKVTLLPHHMDMPCSPILRIFSCGINESSLTLLG